MAHNTLTVNAVHSPQAGSASSDSSGTPPPPNEEWDAVVGVRRSHSQEHLLSFPQLSKERPCDANDVDTASCDRVVDLTRRLPLDNGVLLPLAMTVQANLMASQEVGEDAMSSRLESVSSIEDYLQCLAQVTECPESYVIVGFLYQLRYQVNTERIFCGSDWRTACLVSLVVAQKTFDDFVLSNIEFTPMLGDETAERINGLEHELLRGMKWKLFVPREEFNAYVLQLKKVKALMRRRGQRQ